MQFTQQIENWFDRTEGRSLLLPDGWYGRPRDNQHALTSITEVNKSLIINLDRVLTLHFRGLRSLKSGDSELILGDFEGLRFEWESFGANKKRGFKEFTDGEVRIISSICP